MPSSRKPGCSRFTRPGCRRDSLDERNSQLESRMRENRTYGSEGGEAKAFPTPIKRPIIADTASHLLPGAGPSQSKSEAGLARSGFDGPERTPGAGVRGSFDALRVMAG